MRRADDADLRWTGSGQVRRRVMIAALTVLLGVLLVGVLLYFFSVDRIVARGLERYGSEVLGTPVRVRSVTIRALAGQGTIRGLRVAEPTGFGSGDVIAFDEVTLGIDPASLVSRRPIVLTLVRVERPVVTYVLDGNGRSNLNALEANIRKRSERGGPDAAASDGGASPGGSEAGEATPTRLSIRRLVIEDGRISADLSTFGIGVMEAPLPSIQLTDVGGREGAPPREVASIVGGALVERSLTAVARSPIGGRVEQLLHLGGAGVKGLLDSLRRR